MFAIGAALFALGAILSLIPALAAYCSLSNERGNLVFFVGSVPFTTFTLLGAIAFLAGALLLLPEAAVNETSSR